MKLTSRTLFSFVLFLAILPTVCSLSQTAAAADEIQPFYANVLDIASTISISTSGMSSSFARVRLRDTTTEAELTISLQRSRDGVKWETVMSWTTRGSMFVSLEKPWQLLSGYSYRVYADAKIYNADGTLIEHIVKASAKSDY